MVRTVVSVIVGYLAMILVVFLSLSLAYLAMGQERTFQPGSYDVTAAWLAIMFAVSVLAALVGGFVCASIATSPKAPLALAAVVVVVGILCALPALMPPKTSEPRQGDVGNFEAMDHAREPAWVALLLPVIGAGGSLAAAKLKRRVSESSGSSQVSTPS